MALFILLLCFSLSIQLDKYEYFLSQKATDLVGTCVHVKGGTAKTGQAGQFATAMYTVRPWLGCRS